LAQNLTVRIAAPAFAAGTLLLALLAGAPAVDRVGRVSEEPAMRSVLPEAGCGVFVRHVFVSGPADTFVYCAGYRNADTTALVGYTVTARRRGYSSSIVTMAGVGLDGKIVGIKILAQKETPKSGAKIAEVSPNASAADLAIGRAGPGGTAAVAIELDAGSKAARCVVVEIKDTLALSEIEKALAKSDTAAIAALAPKAFRIASKDTLLLCGPAALETSRRVVERLREDAVPRWQQQFLGKSAGDLVLTKEKSAKSIQAVTGATLSSGAVTESVKAAIVALGEAVGGFKGAKP